VRLAVPKVVQWQCQKKTSVYQAEVVRSIEGIRYTANRAWKEVHEGCDRGRSIGAEMTVAFFYVEYFFYNGGPI
jgi:hypothetical protein